MGKYEALFTPLKVGSVTLKNRIILTAMGGTSPIGFGGQFEERTRAYYVARAKANVGLMIPGVTAVSGGGFGKKWLYESEELFHGPLKQLMDEIHPYGAKFFLQHDIGVVQTSHNGMELAKRYFINIAGFGFDAEVIYDVTHKKPHFLGISVYILSLIRTIFSFRSQPVEVVAPNFQFSGKTFLMVAAICQFNGGGMRQAPMAVPDDGFLDVVVVPKVSNWTVFKNFKKIFSGDHIHTIKSIKTCKTDHLKVSSTDLLRGEVEGELLITGNYRVEVIPGALNVLTNLP